MGSKGSNTVTTQSQQQYTPTPAVGTAGTTALTGAEQAAAAPFQQPVAPVAGFSPFQQLAFGETLGTQGMAQPYFGLGSQYLMGSAAPVSGQDVANYYNPMAQNVFANLQDIFGQQMRETTGQATQLAGGVGADRIGVAQANLAKQQGLAAGQTASQLYQQALQAAEQQKQMMAGAGYGLGQMGPAAQAAQLQGIQALLGAGGMQQQLSQAQMNALYQNQLARIAYPFQTAQYLAGITGGLAPAMGGTTQGTATTTYPQPSPLAQILGLGTAGIGALGQMGSFGGLGGMGSAFASAPSIGMKGAEAAPLMFLADGGAADSTYGKLADKAYLKELGDIVPAVEAGNPMADIMMHDIGGSLPMQAGGAPIANPFGGMSPFQQSGVSPFHHFMPQQIQYSGVSPFHHFAPQRIAASTQLTPYQHQALGGMKGSQVGMQAGGEIQPMFPGASVPGVGSSPIPLGGATMPQGLSPIPYSPVRSAQRPMQLDLRHMPLAPPTLKGQESLSGDIAQALKMATAMRGLSARGGAVNPFDVGQSFQEGGDAEEIDATDLGPVDVTPASPAQRQADTTALALASRDPGSTVASPFTQTEQPGIPPMAAPRSYSPSLGQAQMPSPFAPQQPYPGATQQDWGQRMARSPWMALIRAGAQMAQTRGPIGSVIGAGLGAAAGELEGQRQQLRSEEQINQKADALYQAAQRHLDTMSETKRYHNILEQERSDRLQQQKYQWQPGTGRDPTTGAQVSGAWRMPTKPGEQPEFMPGMNITGRGGLKETALERNVNYLVQHKIASSETEAFNILHHSLQDQAVFQRLVQNEQKFLADRPENAGKQAPAIRAQAEENIRQAQRDVSLRTPPATAAGTQADPIPYTQGMKPELGKFYRMPDGTVRPAQ